MSTCYVPSTELAAPPKLSHLPDDWEQNLCAQGMVQTVSARRSGRRERWKVVGGRRGAPGLAGWRRVWALFRKCCEWEQRDEEQRGQLRQGREVRKSSLAASAGGFCLAGRVDLLGKKREAVTLHEGRAGGRETYQQQVWGPE